MFGTKPLPSRHVAKAFLQSVPKSTVPDDSAHSFGLK
jgi:hypothetical protein